MKILRYIIIISVLIVNSLTLYSLENKNNRYYFPDLFHTTVEDEKTAEDIIKKKKKDKDLLRQAGVYYFIKTSSLPKSDSKKEKYARQAIDIFESLWKRDRKDNLIRIQLGYSYTALGDVDIEMEEMIDYVFKGRNLFSMVAAEMPDNIDARLARNMINMNLPAEAGRPDDMVLEDSLKYIEVYEQLGEKEQNDEYRQMGINIMRLAAAMIYDHRKQSDEAKKHFMLIDTKHVNSQFMHYYDDLEKSLSK